MRTDGAPVVSLTFLCHWASGEAQALEDTAEVQWFSLEQLQTLPGVPDFLKLYIRALAKYLDQEKNPSKK
jgi:hypothetical protein